MIKVSKNRHAKCDACGKRPDDLLVHLSDYDVTFTLCADCGADLARALAEFVSSKIPNRKSKFDVLFGKAKKTATKRHRGSRHLQALQPRYVTKDPGR